MQIQASTQVTGSGMVDVGGRDPLENVGKTRDIPEQQRVNPKEATPNQQDVVGATKKLQDFVSNVRGDIQFSTDESSGAMVVKVIDRTSKDVIMQLPSREALEIAKALDKFQGLLVKQQA